MLLFLLHFVHLQLILYNIKYTYCVGVGTSIAYIFYENSIRVQYNAPYMTYIKLGRNASNKVYQMEWICYNIIYMYDRYLRQHNMTHYSISKVIEKIHIIYLYAIISVSSVHIYFCHIKAVRFILIIMNIDFFCTNSPFNNVCRYTSSVNTINYT